MTTAILLSERTKWKLCVYMLEFSEEVNVRLLRCCRLFCDTARFPFFPLRSTYIRSFHSLQDIVALLRIYCADPCSEIVVSTLCGTQSLVDRLATSIHMVAETIIHLLEPLLSHRQRAIRLSSINVSYSVA